MYIKYYSFIYIKVLGTLSQSEKQTKTICPVWLNSDIKNNQLVSWFEISMHK